MLYQDTKYLYIGSDNLIKVSNLVLKSFGEDVQINDATAKMTLYRSNEIKVAAKQTNIGDLISIIAGDAINRGSGEVGIIVKGNQATYGPDLVSDGDFSTNPAGIWTLGSDWAWMSNRIVTITAGAGTTLSQSLDISPGKVYLVSWDDQGYYTDVYKVYLGGTEVPVQVGVTNSVLVTAGFVDNLIRFVEQSGGEETTIDNVSVRELIGALSVGSKVQVNGTDNYDGENIVKSIEIASAVQEVQTIELDAVATAGSFRLSYKGEQTPSVNEQQTVSLTGSPTGGTFTLTFDSQTTTAIDYDATAAEVEAALEALSTIGSGNVSCSGGDLPGSGIIVEFIADLAGQPVSAITGDGANLTGGTSPDVSISETVAGQGLSYNASTSDVQAALASLSTVNSGDIIVSGDTLDVGDMVFTFAVSLEDVPMLEIDITGLTGPTSASVTQTTQGRPEGYQSEVVFDAEYIQETFDGSGTMQEISRGAIDRGDGIVGVPVLNNTLKVGDTVRFWNFKNYDGIHEIVGAFANEIRIAATYVVEEFTGSEYMYQAMDNATDLAFTPTGSDGNYSGILPDTVKLVPNEKYYLEIYITKDTSDLLARYECLAIFFPKKENN